MSAKTAAQAFVSVNNAVSITKKQTVQSKGVWEKIRRVLAIDPERSNGVPLNPWYRNPPPGGNDPLSFVDPVTLPAADIADNPYWKRDNRRSYPKTSVLAQADVAGLLQLGSAASPKVELIGEAGEKALVAAKESEKGVAEVLNGGADVKADVFVDGLPPLPSGQSLQQDGKWDVHAYEVNERSYPEGYPTRAFK